eukprot:3892537-Pyramimonas_sp.AAC.2
MLNERDTALSIVVRDESEGEVLALLRAARSKQTGIQGIEGDPAESSDGASELMSPADSGTQRPPPPRERVQREPSGPELIEAAECGEEGAVREILKAGVPVNHQDADGCTALHRYTRVQSKQK